MQFVTEVHVDEQGRVDYVRWIQVDIDTGNATGAPMLVPTIMVVDQIGRGRVATIFPGARDTARGPFLRATVDATGREWIETDNSGEDKRTLFDLPRLQLAPGERLEG